jgi:ribosomal protein L7/L12
VRIEVSAQRASFASAVFRAGADVFVRWAEVSVEDADFAGSSLMAELPEPAGPDGEPSFLGREQPWADGGWVCHLNAPPAGFTPRVVSARRAKVARLTLSGVDLRACRFAGTHGIDGLRLERVQFAQPPSNRWRLVRWTRRQTVAEEHHWRAEHGHGPSWYEGEVRAPDWLPQASKPPEPEQIAGIYRALRKGREDNKDEPGAADFYYGEMEMRRQKEQTSFDVLLEAAGDRKTQVVEVVRVATRLGQKEAKALVDEASKPVKEDVDRDEADKLRADLEKAGAQVEVKPSKNEEEATRWERRILWLYWLVSGYGLRASRALLALAITIALLGAVPLDLWGFRPDRSYGRALLFALESSISLLRAPEAKLTAGGEVIQIALRLAGPLFFGLALLSLRGRVKR